MSQIMIMVQIMSLIIGIKILGLVEFDWLLFVKREPRGESQEPG